MSAKAQVDVQKQEVGILTPSAKAEGRCKRREVAQEDQKRSESSQSNGAPFAPSPPLR
ncbi:hypothetical protein SBV1_490014 [Verrucomicrobia bacterium]|nr:hypothetical protein SBV1_490014 [Verrucomicrobiota bacterium]